MRKRLLPMLAVLVLSAWVGLADDGPGLVHREGTIRLASRLSARYAWSYYQPDGDAQADAISSGGSVVALTDAGALLRFDRATLRLTRESFRTVAATCLGRGEGDTVLGGFADGRIARVDPAMLEVTELARSTGEVGWVGVASARTEEKPRIAAVVANPRLAVHGLGHDGTYGGDDEPGHPGAFRLDREGRPWLGGAQSLLRLAADGDTPHPLDDVPRLGRSKVEALVADPDHPDGVIAAIADRGVVFLSLPHVE